MLAIAHTAMAADSFTLEKTVDLPPYAFEGRSLDIIGISPGQSPADTFKVLAERFGETRIEKRFMLIGTETVRSQEFDAVYKTEQKNESVSVTFATPSAGSGVLAVKRELKFDLDKGRPSIPDMVAELSRKYGEPSANYKDDFSNGRALVWYLGGRQECEGPDVMCYTGFGYRNYADSFEPQYYQSYIDALEAGCDVAVFARIAEAPAITDGKVRFLDILFVDLKRRGLTAKADLAAIQAALDSFEKKPVAMPQL